MDDLLAAFAAVWESAVDEFAFIAREEISVQDKMQDILIFCIKATVKWNSVHRLSVADPGWRW